MVTSRRVVRILHLLDRDADFETQRASDGLARSPGEGFELQRRTIGRGGDFRDVANAAARLRRGENGVDLIHAFGGRALAVAALGARGPIVFSPAAETKTRTIHWLRAVMEHRDVQVVCPTATLRRRMIERGIAIDRCHLIRPGVEFSRVSRRRDDALREALGFSRDDHVLLAVGESTRAAAHADAMWATTVLNVVDPKYKLLLWGRGPKAKEVQRFARVILRGHAISLAEQRLGRRIEFEELLPATDTVLATSRGATATLPVAICMAAGLPIVSTVTYTLSELLEDRHTALMSPAAKPRMLARRVLDLMDEAGTQWSIADMARTEAFEFFAFTRFVKQFREVYEQTTGGEKVVVTEDAPGAGLRFHGRA